jgi:hypothetical protein
MMTKTVVSLALTGLLVFGASAGCDDDDGKQACESFNSKCPAGSSARTCDAKTINDSSNAGPVEDCIQGAADCPAATACLATLKP